MNEREAVASSGGHALGGAMASGHLGLWQGGEINESMRNIIEIKLRIKMTNILIFS